MTNAPKNVEFINELENGEKIYAFQCCFCDEKFELGPNLEARQLEHYYGIHKKSSMSATRKRVTEEDLVAAKNKKRRTSDHDYSVSVETVYLEEDQHVSQILPEPDEDFIEVLVNPEIEDHQLADESDDDTKNVTVLIIRKAGKKFNCSDCSMKFRSNVTLEAHQAITHREINECKICSSKFKSHLNYFIHMKQKHKMLIEKKSHVECFHCDETFSNKQSLEHHLVIHYEPEFECLYCNKTFNKNEKHVQHLLTEHKLIIKYICEYCNKKFLDDHCHKVHLDHTHARREKNV